MMGTGRPLPWQNKLREWRKGWKDREYRGRSSCAYTLRACGDCRICRRKKEGR
jgi:hypothetical protein